MAGRMSLERLFVLAQEDLRRMVPECPKGSFCGVPWDRFEKEDLLRMLHLAGSERVRQHEQHDQDLQVLGGV